MTIEEQTQEYLNEWHKKVKVLFPEASFIQVGNITNGGAGPHWMIKVSFPFKSCACGQTYATEYTEFSAASLDAALSEIIAQSGEAT